MIERPRLFMDYSELPEISRELGTLAMDVKTITVLQHDEKKNWELNEAYEEICRAIHRLARVYDQTKSSTSKEGEASSQGAQEGEDPRPERPMTDLEKMVWGIEE